jgi:hypothetical protein
MGHLNVKVSEVHVLATSLVTCVTTKVFGVTVLVDLVPCKKLFFIINGNNLEINLFLNILAHF